MLPKILGTLFDKYIFNFLFAIHFYSCSLLNKLFTCSEFLHNHSNYLNTFTYSQFGQ